MRRRQAGFTLVEIMLAVAIIGIMTAIATPMLLSYYQGCPGPGRGRAGHDIPQPGAPARHRAERVDLCAHHIDGNALPSGHLRRGATWIGPGTDAAGNIPVPAGITLSPIDANLIFNYLGGSTAGTTCTITHTPSSQLACTSWWPCPAASASTHRHYDCP